MIATSDPDMHRCPVDPLVCLDDRHRAELQESGLSDETIRAAGLFSAAGKAIADIVGWRRKGCSWGRGLVYPFRKMDGADSDYARVKLDSPRHDDRGRTIKYESPRKQQNRAFFPPGFAQALASADTILFTEGEKKTLAAAQAGFCCIGLVGIWGFQKKRQRDDCGKVFGARQLIPDVVALDWRGRAVVIMFDSDVADRPDLQIAEYRLAELLASKGALVQVARLPKIGEDKTGLDDFLVHHGEAGPAELRRIIEFATAPERPKVSGPMDIAKIMVDEAFTGASGITLRYYREEFRRFVGKQYVQVPESELIARVLRWIDERGLSATPRLAADVAKCLAALCIVPFEVDLPCWLDGEQHGDGWVSFENGLFKIGDPYSIQSMPHTARFFSPWSMDYPFNQKAECPQWTAFLEDVLDGDPERIDLLQRWFGLVLTSDTSFQKLLLLIGPPRAGKGTIVRVIGAMIGRANCASPTLSSLATNFGLAGLLNKTVAIMPDAHIGKRTDGIRVAEVLKSIVGEDPQDIDRKYKPVLSAVRLPVRFVISCNELAHFTDPSGALAARISAVPFFNSYLGREDRTLEARLQSELPGIVNWALVGLARLRAEGRLNVPARSQAIHDNFTRLSSPTAAFLEDCAELHPNFSEMVTNVFAAWIGWCKANGHEAGSSARLGERLRSVNPAIERTRLRDKDSGSGQRHYMYRGLRLTPVGQEHQAEGEHILAQESRAK